MVSYLSYVSQSKTRFCLFFDESNNEKSKSYLDTKLFWISLGWATFLSITDTFVTIRTYKEPIKVQT